MNATVSDITMKRTTKYIIPIGTGLSDLLAKSSLSLAGKVVISSIPKRLELAAVCPMELFV